MARGTVPNGLIEGMCLRILKMREAGFRTDFCVGSGGLFFYLTKKASPLNQRTLSGLEACFRNGTASIGGILCIEPLGTGPRAKGIRPYWLKCECMLY